MNFNIFFLSLIAVPFSTFVAAVDDFDTGYSLFIINCPSDQLVALLPSFWLVLALTSLSPSLTVHTTRRALSSAVTDRLINFDLCWLTPTVEIVQRAASEIKLTYLTAYK